MDECSEPPGAAIRGGLGVGTADAPGSDVIKQLNKKLRLMEGFASLANAERCVRLLVGCYRFKRFTDSCRGNGKAPLEHAGVDLAGGEWSRGSNEGSAASRWHLGRPSTPAHGCRVGFIALCRDPASLP